MIKVNFFILTFVFVLLVEINISDACSIAPADPSLILEEYVDNLLESNPAFLGNVLVDESYELDNYRFYKMTVQHQYAGSYDDVIVA